MEQSTALRVDSVVEAAYTALRALVEEGELAAGARIGQAELADRFGISRGSVREALHRLTGDGLVEFRPNRGFFVARFGLEQVLRRLETRLLLEPGIAGLAAKRRTDEHLAELRRLVAAEEAAPDVVAAHDRSRAFHLTLAEATGNEELVRVLDSLWIVDVGRRLLAERAVDPGWQHADAAEHAELLRAVEQRDAKRASSLMRAHVEDAMRFWSGSDDGRA